MRNTMAVSSPCVTRRAFEYENRVKVRVKAEAKIMVRFKVSMSRL